ncbi:MAG: aspartate kinase [Coriobacteriales bacterium]|jgi:aspartate kinase|nr:aspartate kinase [Coriobacteriales bacterium]
MDLVVAKFGGTSLASSRRIRNVARRLFAYQQQGYQVLAVVSAMGKTTDGLLTLAREVNAQPPARELDVLLATGEMVSMSLLAMAIEGLGGQAVSMTGRQAGIVTTTRHNKAQISRIQTGRIRRALDKQQIVIVAGFQGITRAGALTTLGRGGSDTSAVALAAALGAQGCELYTDVEGIYSADPRLVPRAHKLDSISYEEMLELAAAGAGVLQMRAVEFARNFGVELTCRSAFSDNPGTLIKEADMESALVSGIAYDNSEAKITIRGVPDALGIAATVFAAIAHAGISVDMIVQNISENGHTDISFTLPAGDLARLLPVLDAQVAKLGAREYLVDESITKLSLVGAGMRTNPGVAAKMFKVLSQHKINIEMISTSAIRISVVIATAKSEQALRALHTAFDLDGDEIFVESQLTPDEQAAKAQKGR